MSEQFELDANKLGELILYSATNASGDSQFGMTRLYKQLFLADFLAYRELGRPISGATYEHRQRGPAPRGIDDVRSRLTGQGRLRLAPVDVAGHTQQRPVALDEPDMSAFGADELKILGRADEEPRGLSASEVSEWSHQRPGWRLTAEREEIPYYTAFMWHEDPINRADLEWAREVVERDRRNEL